MVLPRVLVSVTVLVCFIASLAHGATRLPPDEVEALQQIGITLGKTDWDFSVDPCSGWNNSVELGPVNCNCSFENNTICHVFNLTIREQNLAGTLPPELVRLPFLQRIDLTRNYLNGTIPSEWGSTQLQSISLLGNRLTGPIPKELGNISTLTNLVLDDNHISGPIPEELGDLPLIEKILLTSNNLSGELPRSLAKLITLTDFRIGDNHLSGSIPDFLGNWTNLEKLSFQASGLTGPIPADISSLSKLTDLRISDLNSNESNFPDLSRATDLKNLILRNCNISGRLPDYLGKLEKLKVLDLTFNKLSGQIPESFSGALKTDDIYLTGNLLNGTVPDWMFTEPENVDLSYNNFAFQSPGPTSCQPESRKLNLFASSSQYNKSDIIPCLNLRGFHCRRKFHTLNINCGGEEVVDDNIRYEADTDPGGATRFFQSPTNWLYSNTGRFLDDNSRDDYIYTNSSLNISGLYKDARISPVSLTYFGFCMLNGKYNVHLHFAEIMFTSDRTYNSLGRRLFDVYIQGELVLKDFNIKDEAGGANTPVVKIFPIVVTDTTLEIRLYWSGRGTSGIPHRGVYGPLISAISVKPDFHVPTQNGKSMSAGAIVGIVIAVLLTISLALFILWRKGCLKRKDLMYTDSKGLDLQTGSFTLRQIRAATNNFDAANKIGEGGFGPVYKGLFQDGKIIAVKQLSSKSRQGNREFLNEIGVISALQHPNLVKLYGCCIERDQLLLVYEYMENNSLARALFGPEEYHLKLDWPTRRKICIGIARGLAFLHEESRLKIVHRDIKATNVLLDKNLDPKISDFGLAKLDDEEDTHISTRIAGTYGYMAPEYAMHGYLTDKADVYSFGIVALEVVSGRSNTSIKRKEECFYLLDWAQMLKEKGTLIELVDERLGSEFNKQEVMATIEIALRCTDVVAAARPSMSTVVSILEGRASIKDLPSQASFASVQLKQKGLTAEDEVTDLSDSPKQSVSIDVPYTAYSNSTADLYPMMMDTDYLDGRT